MDYKEDTHNLLNFIECKEQYDELISELCIKHNLKRCLNITSKQEYEALVETGNIKN